MAEQTKNVPTEPTSKETVKQGKLADNPHWAKVSAHLLAFHLSKNNKQSTVINSIADPDPLKTETQPSILGKQNPNFLAKLGHFKQPEPASQLTQIKVDVKKLY